MHALQWTDPHFFESSEDEIALQHAIARYHAFVLFYFPVSTFVLSTTLDENSFLDLLSTSPASFFVPTLDIDLVWHTHQLMAQKYDADCRAFVGRFIDQYVSFPLD
jgi:Glycine-rich domain-containing protein-like